MWLSLFLIVLIAAITFFQSIHGLFSGLITCVIAIICCAFAFGIHEYVALELLMGWKPNLAMPLALVLCFIVPLIALRTGMDALIRRSGLLPSIVDKAGGVVFGFVTAMLIVGVLSVGIQMLPFGNRFLGFRQYDVTNEEFDPTEDPNGLLLSPDRFAAGFASLMSGGIFSGKTRWTADHPDYVREAGWSQTVPRDVRCLAPRDAMTIESFEEESNVYHLVPIGGDYGAVSGNEQIPDEPKAGHTFWSLVIKPNADARDPDNRHRFSPYQIRIVGDDRHGVPVQYCPVAVRINVSQNQNEPEYRFVTKTEKRKKTEYTMADLYEPSPDGTIAVAFELPDQFVPRFAEYKMGARRALAPRAAKTADEASAGTDRRPPDEPDTEAREQRSRRTSRGGRTRGAEAVGARFSDELPHSRAKYELAGDAEIRRGVLKEGHIIATINKDDGGREVTRFDVPDGKSLLQIDAVNLRAGSILGKAKSFAVKTVQNYIVTDDAGTQYKLCGQIALADVGRDRVVEVQYYPETIGSIGGVKPFSKIKDRDMSDSDSYELYFLFLIDSGRTVVSFSTSGRSRGEDISDLNLVAP
jgi:uncharacterized membrane protein required for colicin V production